MNKLAVVGKQQIEVKEFKDQRVVTFKDIDLVHERVEGTAARSFRENKDKFIKDEDYYYLTGENLKQFKQTTNFVGSNARELIILTEQGYLMLVKSFTDDLAWQVQRQLVNNYFKDGKSLEAAFQLIERIKEDIENKITELAEQGKENHRPSHRTKLNWNNIIKTYAVCKGDEEVLKQATLDQFNATKWEDIPYCKKPEVMQYIRTLAQDLKMFVQESLY